VPATLPASSAGTLPGASQDTWQDGGEEAAFPPTLPDSEAAAFSGALPAPLSATFPATALDASQETRQEEGEGRTEGDEGGGEERREEEEEEEEVVGMLLEVLGTKSG